jgi:hypothetical protein
VTQFADRAALEHSLAVCRQHAVALTEALEDLEILALDASVLDAIDRGTRRLLDQFAYRYTRLKDDMGARLFPTILCALGEDIATLSFVDWLARLEQLGWLSLRPVREAGSPSRVRRPAC